MTELTPQFLRHTPSIHSRMIANHLSKLLASASLNADQLSIELLAKAAQGSIRDALTLTDQASAHGNGVLENS